MPALRFERMAIFDMNFSRKYNTTGQDFARDYFWIEDNGFFGSVAGVVAAIHTS